MVLLIDGRSADLAPLVTALDAGGFDAVYARTAQGAREILKTRVPHVILCDEDMVDTDPVEFAEAVASDHRTVNVPVVLASREAHLELSRRKGGFPGHGIVRKPLRSNSVAGFLHKLLRTGPGLVHLTDASPSLRHALQATCSAFGRDPDGRQYLAFHHGEGIEILHRTGRGAHGPRLPEPGQTPWELCRESSKK